MKTIIMVFAVLFAATAGFAQTKTTTHRHGTKTHQHKHAVKKYTCPMHPEVVRRSAGKCPKCNMKLVAVKKIKKTTGIREDKPLHPVM